MRLKRLYDHSTGRPVVCGVRVLHAGAVQHFSPDFLAGAEGEGWLSRDGDRIILHGDGGAVVYRVVRGPGRYEDGPINYFDCVRVE